MKPSYLMIATTMATVLAACGQPSDSAGEAATSGPETGSAESTSALPGADPALVAALRCWGYTRASYYLNIASPERAADIPHASNFDMEGWHWRAMHLAHAQDLSLTEFETLRDEVAISNNDLIDDEERARAAGPIQTCIDTAPTIEGDVPELRQG